VNLTGVSDSGVASAVCSEVVSSAPGGELGDWQAATPTSADSAIAVIDKRLRRDGLFIAEWGRGWSISAMRERGLPRIILIIEFI